MIINYLFIQGAWQVQYGDVDSSFQIFFEGVVKDFGDKYVVVEAPKGEMAFI